MMCTPKLDRNVKLLEVHFYGKTKTKIQKILA